MAESTARTQMGGTAGERGGRGLVAGDDLGLSLRQSDAALAAVETSGD